MSGREGKPRLLLVFPGPVFDLPEYFTDRLTRLSETFEGDVVVLGEKAARVRIAGFAVTMLAVEKGMRLGGLFPLLRTAGERARAAAGAARGFDAVVTYDPLKTGLVGRLIAGRIRAPLILEVNGDYADPAVYSDIANPAKRWAKRRAYMALERSNLRAAAGVKLLFGAQLDGVGGVPRRSVLRVFPNYVSLELFRNLGETPEVLFVGHPFHLKGVDVLIDAFKRVSDEFPDWRLKVLGWFPDRTDVDRAVGGHPRIDVHPPVSRPEVARHMGRCGIFVLPSRTEAMGRVLLEAMACGKPRIGSAVGGIPTVIRDGVDGLLFPAGDAARLAAHLRALMSDADLRRRLGAAGATRAGEEFTADAYFDRVREFYSAVLDAAGPAAGDSR